MNSQQCFVPIAPKVILGPDILVRILDSLVQWGEMLPVLPMLVPEVIRVQRCQYQSWNTHAVSPCESLLRAEDEGVGRQQPTIWTVSAIILIHTPTSDSISHA